MQETTITSTTSIVTIAGITITSTMTVIVIDILS